MVVSIQYCFLIQVMTTENKSCDMVDEMSTEEDDNPTNLPILTLGNPADVSNISRRTTPVSLFNNPSRSDVAFLVGPEDTTPVPIPGHKVIIGEASASLDANFTGPYEDRNEIRIIDFERSAFLSVLRFIYIGDLIVEKDHLLGSVKVANKYLVMSFLESFFTQGNLSICCSELTFEDIVEMIVLMKSLKMDELEKFVAVCFLEEAPLKNKEITLNLENVLFVYTLSRSHELEGLRSSCLSYMDKNASTILLQESLLTLSPEELIDIIERETFDATAFEVVMAVMLWLEQNKLSNDNAMRVELLSKIKLSDIKGEDMLSTVWPSGLFTESVILTAMKDRKESKKLALPQSQRQPYTEVVVHRGVTCDNCKACPIQGNRFKCMACENFNLCDDCEKLPNVHNDNHVFAKYKKHTEYLETCKPTYEKKTED